MDKTVRLWHSSCETCISKFRHGDFVTSVAFHPEVKSRLTVAITDSSDEQNNRRFVSGGLDKKLLVWNVQKKKVKTCVELDDMITALALLPDGKSVVIGTDTGKVSVYETTVNIILQILCNKMRMI